MRLVSGTILALSLPVLLSAAPRSGGTFVLSRGEAGPVKSGMTIDQLLVTVGNNATRLVDEQWEGLFSPAIEIYLGGRHDSHPSLVAEVLCRSVTFVVGRIIVYDPRFKTSEGIGVGSTLGQIRRSYRVDWIGTGEDGSLVAPVQQLGMSFVLDARPTAKWYETKEPKLIPDSAKVVSIGLPVQPRLAAGKSRARARAR